MKTQTDTFNETWLSSDGDTKTVAGLVILWSLDAPERVGEVFLLPTPNQPYILGRGLADHDEPEQRPYAVKQRPSLLQSTAPLESPRLSRRQCVVTCEGEQVHVENVGRGGLLWRGQRVSKCTLKPGDVVSIQQLLVVMYVRRPRTMNFSHHKDSSKLHPFGQPDAHGLVGESLALWALRDQLSSVGAFEHHVLLQGESGTGKELVARGIHTSSRRSKREFVSRNAATIPEGIFDAELFGNARNYPNSGMPERIGLVGQADGSTLFLDEIGELPELLQGHLLRLLDRDGEYHRLGESRARRSDVRFIAATNRDYSAIKHDLLARFIVRLNVPTLNERLEDVPLIARHLLREALDQHPHLKNHFFFEHNGQHYPRLAPDLIDALTQHEYTHHVRELATLLWSAVTSSGSGPWIRLTAAVQAQLVPQEASTTTSDTITCEQLTKVMQRHGGVQARVWPELGLKNRYVLRRLLKKFDLHNTDFSTL